MENDTIKAVCQVCGVELAGDNAGTEETDGEICRDCTDETRDEERDEERDVDPYDGPDWDF